MRQWREIQMTIEIIGPMKPRPNTRVYGQREVASILRVAQAGIYKIPGLFEHARPTARGDFGWTWRDIIAFASRYARVRHSGPVKEGTPFLTLEEVAKYLGTTTTALVDWQTRCEGPRVFTFTRQRHRYAMTDVEKWLSSQTAIRDEETEQERIRQIIVTGKAPAPGELNRRFLSAAVRAGTDRKSGGPHARGNANEIHTGNLGDRLESAD